MKFLQKREQFLTTQRVTRSGKALVQACDFEEGDQKFGDGSDSSPLLRCANVIEL